MTCMMLCTFQRQYGDQSDVKHIEAGGRQAGRLRPRGRRLRPARQAADERGELLPGSADHPDEKPPESEHMC
jgi:hypothetical protein